MNAKLGGINAILDNSPLNDPNHPTIVLGMTKNASFWLKIDCWVRLYRCRCHPPSSWCWRTTVLYWSGVKCWSSHSQICCNQQSTDRQARNHRWPWRNGELCLNEVPLLSQNGGEGGRLSFAPDILSRYFDFKFLYCVLLSNSSPLRWCFRRSIQNRIGWGWVVWILWTKSEGPNSSWKSELPAIKSMPFFQRKVNLLTFWTEACKDLKLPQNHVCGCWKTSPYPVRKRYCPSKAFCCMDIPECSRIRVTQTGLAIALLEQPLMMGWVIRPSSIIINLHTVDWLVQVVQLTIRLAPPLLSSAWSILTFSFQVIHDVSVQILKVQIADFKSLDKSRITIFRESIVFPLRTYLIWEQCRRHAEPLFRLDPCLRSCYEIGVHSNTRVL